MQTSKNTNALVSVVLCFFNEEQFLGEAIASVIGQTYQHWELILIDDGSSDKSPEIAKRYAEQYSNMKYDDHAKHANKGLSASRNRGISQASGKYIAFLDADDVWLPEKLEEQTKIMLAHPEAGMTCGASLYWYSWSDAAKEDVVIPIGTVQDTLVYPPALSKALYPLGKGAAPCPSGIMVTKKAVDHLGGFEEHFNGIYQLYEDQGFLSKVYLQFPVFINGACLDKYRQRPESIVAVSHRDGNYKKVRLYYLKWLKKYLNNKEIDHAIIKLVDRALRDHQGSWLKRKLNQYLKLP